MVLWSALLASALAGPEVGGHLATHLHVAPAAPPADTRLLDLGDLAEVGIVARQDLRRASWRVAATGRLGLMPHLDEVRAATEASRVIPVDVEVAEAWVEATELLPGVSVRLGQQRLAWGTTEGISPVDAVNPYDLRDPTRFDRRLGSPAITAVGLRGVAALELAWLPLHRPARLPAEVDLLATASDVVDLSTAGGEGLVLGDLETRADLPDERVGFGAFAGRLELATALVDLAASGWYGVESLPQVGGEALLVGFATSSDRVDVGVPVLYPRATRLGLEARAELPGEVLFLAESTLTLPERTSVTASRSQLEGLLDLGLIDEIPSPLPETVTQDGRPVVHAVVGLQRTWSRVLLLAEWAHGLPTERQRSEVGDYALVATQLTLTDAALLDLQGLVGVDGGLGRATLRLLHGDALELTLGGVVVVASVGASLAPLAPLSHIELGASISY